MKLVLYSLPGCGICHGVEEMLTSYIGAGKLDVEFEVKLADGAPSDELMETMVEIAFVGVVRPPAVVLYGDDGSVLYARGPISSLHDVELQDITKARHEVETDTLEETASDG